MGTTLYKLGQEVDLPNGESGAVESGTIDDITYTYEPVYRVNGEWYLESELVQSQSKE